MSNFKKSLFVGALTAIITCAPLFAAQAASKIYFSSPTFSQDENGGTATITVIRSIESFSDLLQAVSVDFATSAGTATAGVDYTGTGILPVNFDIIFDISDISDILHLFSQIITVSIIDDAFAEGNETVLLTLSNPTGATLDDPSSAVLTIIEDDTEAICGNGVFELGEQCDDGNITEGDGCNSICKLEVCGDGIVNNAGLEQCDDGNTLGGDCCDENCRYEIAGSPCSDGNTCSAVDRCDGVSVVCTGSGSTCGDGVFDAGCGELCDDGNLDNGDGCNSICQTEFCGDGSVNNLGTEQCDDRNAVDLDGCDSTCQTEVCGDGTLNNGAAEQCDDGNTAGGDGCSSTCQWETCGDGVENNNGTEQCDDGNVVDLDGCDKSCHAEFCGDGIVNNNEIEQCDDGSAVDLDGCSSTCRTEFCGDGSVNNNGTEECDDGNLNDGDGCDKSCKNEVPAAAQGTEEPTSEAPTDGDSAGSDVTDTAFGVTGGGCSLIVR